MKRYFQKFVMGIRMAPYSTLLRSASFLNRQAKRVLENFICFVALSILRNAPVRAKVMIKTGLPTQIELDYSRRRIELCADSDMSIRRAMACGKEPETVAWIEANLRPGDVLFDIGANVGAYSLIAAKQFSGEVKIFSFEPSFSTYDQLCRNVIINDCQDNVFPFLMALTDKSKLLTFEYRSLVGGAAEHAVDLSNDAALTFKPVFSQRLLGNSMDELAERFGFPPPTLIKLDVDGAEIAILEGAKNTLCSPQLKSVLVEVREDDGMAGQVKQLLEEAGFLLVEKYDRGNGVVWNYIFHRNNSV